jgi:hypothetical protein
MLHRARHPCPALQQSYTPHISAPQCHASPKQVCSSWNVTTQPKESGQFYTAEQVAGISMTRPKRLLWTAQRLCSKKRERGSPRAAIRTT